jgi:hypothetical protein
MGNTVKRKNFDPEKSLVKLVVYNTHNEKKTIYNFLSENKLGVVKIIERMKKRVLREYFKSQFRLAIFYDKVSGDEIEKISNSGAILSKVKLVVYRSGDETKTRYSKVDEEKLTTEFTIGAMMNRVLVGEFRNQYRIGIFYDTKTNEEITYFLGAQSEKREKRQATMVAS